MTDQIDRDGLSQIRCAMRDLSDLDKKRRQLSKALHEALCEFDLARANLRRIEDEIARFAVDAMETCGRIPVNADIELERLTIGGFAS